jgi:hypothetical protein
VTHCVRTVFKKLNDIKNRSNQTCDGKMQLRNANKILILKKYIKYFVKCNLKLILLRETLGRKGITFLEGFHASSLVLLVRVV